MLQMLDPVIYVKPRLKLSLITVVASSITWPPRGTCLGNQRLWWDHKSGSNGGMGRWEREKWETQDSQVCQAPLVKSSDGQPNPSLTTRHAGMGPLQYLTFLKMQNTGGPIHLLYFPLIFYHTNRPECPLDGAIICPQTKKKCLFYLWDFRRRHLVAIHGIELAK